MKKYFSPILEITVINTGDVIAASFEVNEMHGGDIYSLDELINMYETR